MVWSWNCDAKGGCVKGLAQQHNKYTPVYSIPYHGSMVAVRVRFLELHVCSGMMIITTYTVTTVRS